MRRLAPLVALLAAVGGACLLFRGTELGRVAEYRTVDWRFRNFSDPRRHDPSIVLLSVDQASLDHFAADGIGWPWPRSLHGRALEFLRKAGAKTVVFDVLFTDSVDTLVSEDQAFAKEMRAFGLVVNAMASGPAHRKDRPAAPPARFAVDPPAHRTQESAALPNSTLLAASAALGDVTSIADPDGVFRRVPLTVRIGTATFPTLPAAAAMAYSGKSLAELAPGLSAKMVPVRFHGLGRTDVVRLKTYTHHSYGDAILSMNAWEEGKKKLRIDPASLKGKLVFVGLGAKGLMDVHPSPIAADTPGTEVVAAAADNLLNSDWMREAGTGPAALLVALALLIAGLASRLSRYAWISIGVVALASAALTAAAVAAFRHGVLLDLAVPQLALWLGFAAASAWSFAVEGRQHRYIQAAFGHYLSPEIVRRIADSPDSLRLGGERREVTFYFSDIAGFTTFSEKLEPEALTKLMNTYLGHMTDTVLETGGTLDKYIGDAVMAFWGAPLDMEGHALVACKAALKNQAKLVKLREEWAKAGWPPVHNRIGLNTGPAIIGNMGSPRRFSYTAIGDNVNLASRLEGANKPYGTYIMLSESTRLAAGDAIEVRELDYVKVKGKNKPIRVYELLGLKGETDPRLLAKARSFEQGLALLRARKLDEARAAFRAVVAESGPDEACELFLERCDEVAAEPPPPDWDGSFALTEK